jgi:hypothetical protein
MSDVSGLINTEIVITEKVDGGNACFTSSNVYARTHSVAPSEYWWDACKALHANVRFEIDPELSVFGENVWAVHSIEYDNLPSTFLIFNVRNDSINLWWEWDLVELMSSHLNIPTVPVLFRGTVKSEEELKTVTESLANLPSAFGGMREGVVVRVAREFKDDEFSTCLAKWVRHNHVQTDEHWTKHVRPQRSFRK